MTYNFDYISTEFRDKLSSALSIPRKVDKSLSYKIYKDAIVFPFYDWDHYARVMDNEGRIVNSSKEKSEELWQLHGVDKPKICHKNIAYIGCLNTVFGHWFTDNLEKIWFLLDSRYSKILKEGQYELAYSSTNKSRLTDEAMSFHDLLGINLRDAIFIDYPTQFDNVLLPDSAFLWGEVGHQYTAEMETVWAKISDVVRAMPLHVPELPTKIYFSRTRLPHSKDFGARTLDRVFRKLGYTIIYPETLPVAQKIQLVQHCEYFASTEGSTSHLTLFCNQGTHVTIIPRVRWVNTHQLCCNEFADLDVTYLEADVSSHADPTHSWWGPFYFCITPYVEKYVGHKIVHLPDSLNPDHWKYTKNFIWRIYSWLAKYIKK